MAKSTGLHPIVAEHASRRSKGFIEDSLVTAPSAAVTFQAPLTDADRRAFSILDKIVKHFSAQGFGWELEPLGWFKGKRDGVWIGFRVRERWRKPTTSAERETARRLSGLVPSGDLVAQVGSSTWRDDHRGTIEDKTRSIISAIEWDVEASITRNAQALAEREHARAQAERVAEEKRQDAHLLQVWSKFVTAMETHERLQRARVMLDALVPTPDGAPINGKSQEEWKAWLLGRIEEEDPLHGGLESLLVELAKSAGGD